MLFPSELVESFTITSELFISFPDMGDEMPLVNSDPMPRLASEDNDRDVADGVLESRGTGGKLRGLTSETSSLLSSKYTTSCIVS